MRLAPPTLPLLTTTLLALTGVVGCKSKETFPSLGDAVASPVDVAVSDAGDHFFVLNADFDRTYDVGSILVLDKQGEKVGTVEVPRMGRTLTVAGNDLLVTFDYRDDGQGPLAQLFDISTPAAPVFKREWELGCSPFGVTMRKDYANFALTCLGGELYIGTLTADRAASELKLVRQYGTSRRAVFLDPTRELLFGFPSDYEQKKDADRELVDASQWNDIPEEVLVDGKPQPNEIPDDMENSKRRASNKAQRHVFQFFVYDLRTERSNAPGCVPSETENCAFPLRTNADLVTAAELRWIYFKLENFDGTPDASPSSQDPNTKYYRTNFWEARPDPTDPDVFYLSHRGAPDKSPYANQIVRVSIIDDPRAADGKAPITERYLSFDRVYGFKGQGVDAEGVDWFKYHFPGDFEIAEVSGQKLLVVNHFRDLVNWVRGDTYFSLGAQVIDDYTWFTEQRGSLDSDGEGVTTYYQVAMNKDGLALSCSFYGNALVMLQVTPGLGMQIVKRIQ